MCAPEDGCVRMRQCGFSGWSGLCLLQLGTRALHALHVLGPDGRSSSSRPNNARTFRLRKWCCAGDAMRKFSDNGS